MIKVWITLLLLSSHLFGEPDWKYSFEEAKQYSYNTNKPIMIMLSREGCDACWYMENIVFKDANVIRLLERFTPVYLDVSKDIVPKAFTYAGTPTFYFTDTTGESILESFQGAANVKDFSALLNEVLEK